VNNDKCKSLPKLLAKEGWTLRQRLDYSQALNLSKSVDESHQLDEWSKIVAPNQTENFIKRLEWSGYTPNQALWALNPPEDAVPAHPSWLDFLTCLRQVLVEAGCSFSQKKSVNLYSTKSQPLPFEELWLPLCDWGVT